MNPFSCFEKSIRVCALLHLAALALVACGGNVVVDHGSETTGSGGGGGGSGTSPSMYGTPVEACAFNTGGIKLCAQVFDTKGEALLNMACGQSKGQLVAACAGQGAIGCCLFSEPTVGTIEECIYQGGQITTAQYKQVCQQMHGKFSTSP
jgi:hypothetical protein